MNCFSWNHVLTQMTHVRPHPGPLPQEREAAITCLENPEVFLAIPAPRTLLATDNRTTEANRPANALRKILPLLGERAGVRAGVHSDHLINGHIEQNFLVALHLKNRLANLVYW